mgnify:CR=1 FL=1
MYNYNVQYLCFDVFETKFPTLFANVVSKIMSIIPTNNETKNINL